MAPHPIPPLRLGLTAPQPSRRYHAQSLLCPSFHDARTPHVLESQPEWAAPLSRRRLRRWAMTYCRLSLRPCPTPSSCSLQPLLKLSLLSLGPSPSLLQLVLIVSLLLNHGKPIFEPVCVFYRLLFCFCLLIETNFSFKSLFAIGWLSPQPFQNYSYLSTVAWQYYKHWTILILVLCLLCVAPLVCSSYSSFAPSSPFSSSRWQRNCELFTHTFVLQGSPSTSSRQPQTTHVFADSRIDWFMLLLLLHKNRLIDVAFITS